MKIIWTPEASVWMDEIREYVARDSPAAAKRVLQGIRQRVQPLRRFPRMGERYGSGEREVRSLLYGHYRIAYLIHDDGNIHILAVLHCALDDARYRAYLEST